MKSLMRTVVASLLLVAVLTGSTSQPSAATADPVQISYVVSRLANSTSLYEGSLKGGTALYIHGVGFDPSASNNQIFVGSYPCDTSAKGVTLDTITCDTTAPTGTSLYNLPVTVMVAGKPPVTCTSTSCMFSYTWQGTPYLYGVYPRAGAANEQIKFYGIHRISQLGDGRSNFDNIRGLYIGGSMCSRFDIIESPIDPNSNQFITCAIPPIQAGGYYNVSEWVAPGYADKNARMQYGSISQGVNYEFMVQPRIKSVSSHSGGDFGQTLTINGDGFSINSTQISVSAANIPCDVVTSTESQITCKVQPNPNGNTFGVLDTNTSATQLSGFLSGSGLQYKRYDITNLSSKTLPNFRSNIGTANVTLVEDSWRSDLMSADVYGSNYVQVFKGYFVAPAAGSYIFRGLADDAIELFLSNVKGSAEVDYSAPLISGQYYSQSLSSRNYYVANYSGLTSAPITMAAGEARYLEVYHFNGYGAGNMLISVEVPNSNTNFANQVYEVQQVTLAPGQVTPQMINYTQTGATGGNMNFHLLRTDPKTFKVLYDVSVDVAWNASAGTFQNMLNQFDIFYGYSPSVVLTKYDAAGVDISATNAAGAKYVWTVTLNKYRAPSLTAQSFLFSGSTLTAATGSATIVETKYQAHSPPLSGTFTLSLDNVLVTFYNSTSKANQVDIPFNTYSWDLANWIAQSWGVTYVEVDVNPNQNFADGVTYIISFVGKPGPKSLIVSDASKLLGGVVGSNPTIDVWRTRAASTRLLSEPVSAEYLFGAASTPQVVVTVNGVKSECQADCSYAVNAANTPTIETAVFNPITGVLSFNVTDPGNLGFLPNQMTVTIDTTPCIGIISSDIHAVTCTVKPNAAGNPLLRTGAYKPIVEIKGVGFARPTAGVSDIPVALTLDSLSNSTAPPSGGTIVGISGSGFPFSSAETVAVNICGKTAFLKTVTNSQIGFVVPPCASASTTVTVTYKGTTSNALSFTYDSNIVAPIITSVSPSSASPVLKTTMTVVGSGFGTDISLLTAYLVNGTGYRTYQLNVLTVSDTQLTVRLSGGLNGTFTVVINKAGFGDSAEGTAGCAQFVYEIVVTSVSPTVGSAAGGTILTITGRNFSPVKANNQVAIGDALNWWCIVLTATSTQITCTTPPLSSQYSVLAQNVVVVGRGMLDSTCGGACTFTYDNATYPTVAVPTSLVYTAGTSYTLTGTNFVNNNVLPKVVVGDTFANVVSATATSVVFIYPALRAGNYSLNVYVDGIGYAYSNPAIVSTTKLNPTGLASATGSRIGNIVKVIGNGLVATTDGNFNLTVTKSGVKQAFTVVGDTPTSLDVLLMGGSDGTIFTFTYTYLSQSWASNYTTLNTSTPKLTLTNTSGVAYSSSQTLSFTRTMFPTTAPAQVSAYPVTSTGARFAPSIPLTFTASATNTSVSVNAGLLGAGKWQFEFFYTAYGFAEVLTQFEVLAPTYTVASVTSSYTGGALLTVSGAGANNLSKLDVGGFPAKLVSYTSSNLVYSIPAYVTRGSQTAYSLAKDGVLTGTPISDTATYAGSAFDKLMSTYYTSSSAVCYIGVDFGAYLTADISRIRYFPLRDWRSVGAYLIGATFKASNDNVTWDTLYTVDSTVHTGWNIWRPATKLAASYRYVKFEHNTTSNCRLAELEISGVLIASTSTSATSNLVDVHFNDGFHATTWAGKVTYQSSTTPTITDLSPKTMNTLGNNPLTITGTGFGTDSSVVQVVIDNVPCVVVSVIDTQIVCTVGARPTLPTQLSFQVSIGGNIASKSVPDFFYAFRWSDPATWGGDIPPIDGDTVYVPVGMVLLVDQSTPNLKTIIVEGSIIFADEGEMVIETGGIIVNFGVFRAGTEQVPYTNKLTFLLHGDYYDKQLPGFGNKAIGCHCCKFDMYGTPKTFTWTDLNATANIGDTSITVNDAVDWNVGDLIVIAASGADHYEAERRTIATISGKVITFDEPLLNKHIGVIETVNASYSFPMRAEVGLLTRNIVVTGDSDSVVKKYGAHVMMHGPTDQGLVAHIAYVEGTNCGQPAIVGRYCFHFHMNGDVSDSYFIGNSVHDSFARILTIHGVHYLTVQKNVGHLVKGHNFFLEDGIETYNVIENNLAIGTIQVWNMLQTDISAASFWITNPLNTVRNNRAGGGDFYGFWYEVKDHPDGPSATSDICPQGMPVGESHDNVAHSYVRFGLRIFKLFSSQNPCKPPRDDSLVDPWSTNPSIQNRFYNYLLWQNSEAGMLAEEMGNTIFDNITVADSGMTGMQFHLTNFSKELVIAQNSIVVGRSDGNGRTLANLTGVYGIITPRTDGLKVSNVAFVKFPSVMTVFRSCSGCENELIRATTGKATFFEGITYTDVNASYIFWQVPRREVYYDLDGSLSSTVFDGTTRTKTTITPYFPHNDIPGTCFNASTPTKWDSAQLCGSNAVVRTVVFTNGMPTSDFKNIQIKFLRLTSPTQDISGVTSGYTGQYVFKTMLHDIIQCWSAPFVLNYMYDTWWNWGVDFTHMSLAPSQYFDQAEPGLIFRFNYTQNRELFELGQMVGGKLQTPLISGQSALLDISTCNAGDFFHDPTNRYLYVCVSGKNKPQFTYIDVNGIKCRYLCPQPEGEFVKEPFIRQWSNVTQWPGGVLPAAGANVTVNGNWTIIMDIDPAPMNNLTINGDVFVSDRDTVIQAKFIWIRAGSLNAGNSSAPFKFKLTINLMGSKNDVGYTVDPIVAGNKYIVVTGTLNLYGLPPGTVWTQLTSKGTAGTNSITVASVSDWAVGDQLVIAPSFSNYLEYENVTITAISGKTVTFTPALAYNHFGDASATISNTYGTLDMRTAVGHVSRSITINAGADAGHGFRILTYGFLDGTIVRKGATTLVGVRLNNGGQLDTEYAATHFLNTAGNPNPSLVRGCAFYDSNGYSMRLETNANITVTNNVFFLGRKFIVSVAFQQDYAFTNNLMIGALIRPTMVNSLVEDDIACYHQYEALDFAVDNNLVQNNLCQGSNFHGFVFPHTPCGYLGLTTQGFIDNTAGTCRIGFMMNVNPGDCLGGEKLKGYSCNIGFLANPPGPNMIQYQGMMFADNGRGMGLRHAHEGDNNTGILRDSWFSGMARPNCNYCYGTGAADCSGGHAIRMMVTTKGGERFPDKYNTNFDVVCNSEVYDTKAYLFNVTFDSYRKTYTNTNCSNNVIFKPHPGAFDFTGGHYLYQTSCVNCETNALAYFSPPDGSKASWFGGCGLLNCTGNNNYIVQDHDGSLLGQPGVLVANNSWIGDGESGCTWNPSINGYICFRDDIAVLEYESIAPDFNLRIMWPVTLNYWGGNWTSVTNGWREWDWKGPEPQNRRLGRFVSTVRLGQSYNMSFSAQPPSDMRFQIQRRTMAGNNSDWLAIWIYYPVANAITVMIGRTPVDSILATSAEDVTNRSTVCGANKYFYKNGTIAFIVTGDPKCQVRVSLNSNVQITARLMVNINTFFNNNGVATFIDKMCAFLNITTDRLKVVGVYEGSAIIDATVSAAVNTTADNSTNTTVDPVAVKADLNAIADKLAAASPGAINLGGAIGAVGSVSATVSIVNVDGSPYTDPTTTPTENASNKTTIIIAVVVSVLSAALVGVTTWLVIKKIRSRGAIQPEATGDRSNIEVQKDVEVMDLDLQERELSENKSNIRLDH